MNTLKLFNDFFAIINKNQNSLIIHTKKKQVK